MYGLAFPFFDSAETKNATTAATHRRPPTGPRSSRRGSTPASTIRAANASPWARRTGASAATRTSPRACAPCGSSRADSRSTRTRGPGLGARDSKVGLQSPVWGEIFLGQWDTPYKCISLPMNPLRGGYVFDCTAITGNPGFGVQRHHDAVHARRREARRRVRPPSGQLGAVLDADLGRLRVRVAAFGERGHGRHRGGRPRHQPVVNSFAAAWTWSSSRCATRTRSTTTTSA